MNAPDRLTELADELAELDPQWWLYAAPSREEVFSSGVGLSGNLAEWQRVLAGLRTRVSNRDDRVRELKAVVRDMHTVICCLLSYTPSDIQAYGLGWETMDRADEVLRRTQHGEVT